MTSAMPRTAAASCSSRVRTPARSPSGTSAGSLTEPRSPRDAHISTTRAPASERRASVPPQASDSSSGCAKTARTVRPSRWRSALRFTAGLHETIVDRDVFLDHAPGAEACHRALVDALAIEIEHTSEVVDHLLEILEDDAGDPVVDHFPYRAAIERGDRRAAGHRFGQDQAERLTRLDRIEQRARPAVEPHLGREVGFAVVLDVAPVDVGRHLLAIVIVFRRRQNQPHADALGDFDRLEHALAGGEAA